LGHIGENDIENGFENGILSLKTRNEKSENWCVVRLAWRSACRHRSCVFFADGMHDRAPRWRDHTDCFVHGKSDFSTFNEFLSILKGLKHRTLIN